VGEFVGSFVPPDEDFRAAVSGTDSEGRPFERILPAVYTTQPLHVDLDREASASQIPLRPGGAQLTFRAVNLGPSGRFEVQANGTEGFLRPLETTEISIPEEGTGSIALDVEIPKLSPAGAINLSLVLSSTSNASITNNVFLTLPLSSDYSSFHYEDVAVPIGESAMVEIPLEVSGMPGGIQDLLFTFAGEEGCPAPDGVGLSYPNVAELDISLISPLGTVATLVESTSTGGGANFCRTLFDDSATAPISTAIQTGSAAPFSGSYSPATPLSVFDGENPNGTWRLVVMGGTAAVGSAVRGFGIHLLAPSVIDSFQLYRDNLLGRIRTPGLNDLNGDGLIDAGDLFESTRLGG
jgi:hypothetical protein